MRVIAGKLRSRTLHAPSGYDTRPTHDRVREALFSVLGDVTDYRVLDLCAGTGSLGIEALSRGAHSAVFVEQGKEALRCLNRNLTELTLLPQSTVVASRLEACRARVSSQSPYHLVFCDPPWIKVPELLLVLERLDLPTLLTEDGTFVLEHSAKFDSRDVHLTGLQIETQRRWGDTAVTLFSVAGAHELRPADDGAL
jgi:16S rRNA (guanine966-N2)-methyltransferase